MAIQRWHVGKLILLWAWSVLLAAVLIGIIRSLDNRQFVVGFMLIGALLGIAILMSMITWKWLGGKEH